MKLFVLYGSKSTIYLPNQIERISVTIDSTDDFGKPVKLTIINSMGSTPLTPMQGAVQLFVKEIRHCIEHENENLVKQLEEL